MYMLQLSNRKVMSVEEIKRSGKANAFIWSCIWLATSAVTEYNHQRHASHVSLTLTHTRCARDTHTHTCTVTCSPNTPLRDVFQVSVSDMRDRQRGERERDVRVKEECDICLVVVVNMCITCNSRYKCLKYGYNACLPVCVCDCACVWRHSRDSICCLSACGGGWMM